MFPERAQRERERVMLVIRGDRYGHWYKSGGDGGSPRSRHAHDQFEPSITRTRASDGGVLPIPSLVRYSRQQA